MSKEDWNDLRLRLCKERVLMDMSYRELAKNTGLHVAKVWRNFNTSKPENMQLRDYLLICRALGLNSLEIIREREEGLCD